MGILHKIIMEESDSIIRALLALQIQADEELFRKLLYHIDHINNDENIKCSRPTILQMNSDWTCLANYLINKT